MSNPNEAPVLDRTTASSIEKMLNEDITEEEVLEVPRTEVPKDDEPEVSEDDDEKLEDDIKLELEDLEDDDEIEPKEDELATLNFPRRKEILKKYPDVFKDFPALETAYYKVNKVNEIFPSLDDARLAAEKAVALDNFERDIMSGNIELLLGEVKRQNGNSFNKVVDNLFTAIHKIDPQAVTTLQKNVIGRMINAMYVDAKEQNNDAISNAADIVKTLIFGNGKVEIAKLAQETKPDPEKEKLQREIQTFNQQKFETTAGELAQGIRGTLTNTIEKLIDPKGSMTPYVKKHAMTEALDYLEQSMRADTQLRPIIDRCWQNIFRNNYSPESIDKLKKVYKTRAATLMPTAIKKARNEALKTKNSNSEGNNKVTSGKVAPVKDDAKTPSGRQGRKMSTYDYLMKD